MRSPAALSLIPLLDLPLGAGKKRQMHEARRRKWQIFFICRIVPICRDITNCRAIRERKRTGKICRQTTLGKADIGVRVSPTTYMKVPFETLFMFQLRLNSSSVHKNNLLNLQKALQL